MGGHMHASAHVCRWEDSIVECIHSLLPSHGSKVQSQLVGLVWQAPGPLRLCPRADTTIETPILTLVLSWEHWRCFFTEILEAYMQLSSARCQLTNLPLLVYADHSGGHRTPKAEWGWTSPETSSASLLPQTTPPMPCPSHHEKLYPSLYRHQQNLSYSDFSGEVYAGWLNIHSSHQRLILGSENHNYHKEK